MTELTATNSTLATLQLDGQGNEITPAAQATPSPTTIQVRSSEPRVMSLQYSTHPVTGEAVIDSVGQDGHTVAGGSMLHNIEAMSDQHLTTNYQAASEKLKKITAKDKGYGPLVDFFTALSNEVVHRNKQQ